MFDQEFIAAIADEVAKRVLESLGDSQKPQARLLSIDAAAAYIGRSKQATYHLVLQEKIPVKRQGSRLFFDRLALDAWINDLPN